MALTGGKEVKFIPAENQRTGGESAEFSRIAAAGLQGAGTRQSRFPLRLFATDRMERGEPGRSAARVLILRGASLFAHLPGPGLLVNYLKCYS
jgi:hypothetical protein